MSQTGGFKLTITALKPAGKFPSRPSCAVHV